MNTKERPNCRETIIRAGWRPNPQPEVWDCKSALSLDGREISLTPGLRKQMGKMLEEGHWGKAVSIRKIKESEEERERRMQLLCDNMTILNSARPVAANSGDKPIRVQHIWSWNYKWEWECAGHVPIKTRPFYNVPSWVFEEDNPVSATARMLFAFLCSRGLLNTDERGRKQLGVDVSKKDIGRVLSISEAVAASSLLELEEFEIIGVERLGLKYKREKRYCNFYNANVIYVTEDPTRWSRIKAAQAEDLVEGTETPRRNRLRQTRSLSGPSMNGFAVNGASLPATHSLDEPHDDEDLNLNMQPDRTPQSTSNPEVATKNHHVEENSPTTLTPALRILEKNPSLLNSGEDRDTLIRRLNKTGRNEPCPCTSGRKFKKCCGGIFNS